jgi:hypothetical protein
MNGLPPIGEKELRPQSGFWCVALIPFNGVGWRFIVWDDGEWHLVPGRPYAIHRN